MSKDVTVYCKGISDISISGNYIKVELESVDITEILAEATAEDVAITFCTNELLSFLDEDEIIDWVMENTKYSCIERDR